MGLVEDIQASEDREVIRALKTTETQAPTECEHDFNGPLIDIEDGLGQTHVCRKCRMWEIDLPHGYHRSNY